MNRKLCFVLVVFMILSSAFLFAEDGAKNADSIVSSVKYIAAALAVGIACIAGGLAVGKIGAAAMGALSENPEVSGKALPFAGLAEGICLWGFLVAVLVIFI